jgi:hypothetical protein
VNAVRLRSWRAAAAASAIGLLSLAGCQQPTPSVTIQSGSRSVHDVATAYLRGGKQVRGSTSAKVLRVRPGALVGIDVDGALADHGWSVHITTLAAKGTSNTLDSPTLKGQHHFSFNVGNGTTQIVISEDGAAAPQGLWFFTLQPTLL